MSFNLADLTACGAHRTGHYRLSSGRHSGDYLQCALYLADPVRAEAVGRDLAEAVRALGVEPEVVVSPALGGLIIGHETARGLGLDHLFAERVDGEMTLRRGFEVRPGQPVLIVEDVVTTGRSTQEVLAILEGAQARVVAVAAIVDRSGGADPFAPLPLAALVTVDFPSWEPDACPLCRDGVPLEKPGSRPGA